MAITVLCLQNVPMFFCRQPPLERSGTGLSSLKSKARRREGIPPSIKAVKMLDDVGMSPSEWRFQWHEFWDWEWWSHLQEDLWDLRMKTGSESSNMGSEMIWGCPKQAVYDKEKHWWIDGLNIQLYLFSGQQSAGVPMATWSMMRSFGDPMMIWCFLDVSRVHCIWYPLVI